jgi:membrane-associated phospholipid phosphatase
MIRQAGFLAAAFVVLVSCSDRPTAPNVPLSGATRALHSNSDLAQPTDAVPASVTWQATAGRLVASRLISPFVAARQYGIVGVAQYGAAVAAAPSGDVAEGNDGSNASPRAHFYEMRGAVAAASAQVLSYLFPLDVAQIEAQLASEGALGSPGVQHQFASGVVIGRAIGNAVVARARADGFTNPDGTPRVWDPNSLLTGPTIWRMDADATPHIPAGFQGPTMRPYYLNSPSQFRPPPPPADLISAANAVAAVVNARTPEQAAIATFWNLPNGSLTAMGYWVQLAGSYVVEYGLDEREAAHVLALVSSTGADASIGCFDAKYHYLTLRPWMVDPTDLTNAKLIIGRPNHPSYPSGHSCASASAATVLEAFFPDKSATLEQQVAEAGMSRVYGGIHYFFDIAAGQALGRSVAQWALEYDRTNGLLSAVF